jgi:xanthine dehydrogenase accessory factor
MSDPTFDQIPEQALAWHRAGKGAALATVIETWGSAPRRTGSQLAINGAGEIMGSVSGGCVEGAVIVEAIDAISDGDARELEFGVSGTVLPEPLLAELTAARANRTPAAYVVDLDTGSRHLATTGHETRFALDRSGFEPDSRCFIAIHNPPLRLTVVGAVHIAQALLPMAQMTGYDPVLIDPRESFATAARFPGQTIRHDWPADAVSARGLDTRSALVLLTHDPKLDDPALEIALASDAFYIGALGSNRTHAKRTERLAAKGFAPAQIARIHGPVGLDIGAASPTEIAVSIIAEMTQVLRKGR